MDITEGCLACIHYDWDCDDYGYNSQRWCNKTNAHNLKNFPFKTNAKCWEGKRKQQETIQISKGNYYGKFS